ncbi:MAG TPA: hypothetical protein ENI23_03270 [bacterium]|nr:hypothetical protein [bacterium]
MRAVKRCVKCKINKKFSEFSKHRRSKDGLASWCKECVIECCRKWRKLNSEKTKEYGSKQRRLHSEKLSEQNRKWRKENPEKVREISKRYRDANKEKIKELNKSSEGGIKKWRKENPEKVREYSRRRRAQKVAVEENYSEADENYTRQLFQNCCYNCGSTEKLCIDHSNPLSKGFALTRKNAVLLCWECNGSKHDKMPAEFYSPAKLKKLEKILGITRKR